MDLAEAYKIETGELQHLNQTVNGFEFKVISSLNDLLLEAALMQNSVYEYKHKVIAGTYVMLTIDDVAGDTVFKTHSNLGLNISGGIITFEQAKAKLNFHCRTPVIEAIKEYCKKNSIDYSNSYCRFDLEPNAGIEYRTK